MQATGSGALHVNGHPVPHSVYSWPSMRQIVPINVACSVYNSIANCYIPLLFDEGIGDTAKTKFTKLLSFSYIAHAYLHKQHWYRSTILMHMN